MNYRRSIRLACACAVVGTLLFYLGRVSAAWPKYVPPEASRSGYETDSGPSLQEEEDGFDKIVRAWNASISAHDGFLPADPYQFLHERGLPLNVYEFALHLPPRINRDLSKNQRWPVFWRFYGRFDEVWTCYSDGTWDRLPESEAGADWYTPLKKAGYPVEGWRTWKEESNWTEKNKSRLIWDQAQKLYFVLPS